MTAPTLPVLDTRLLEDIALPCEAPRASGPCEQSAEWIVRVACGCRGPWLLCTDHADAARTLTARGMVGDCGHVFRAAAEPIRGRP